MNLLFLSLIVNFFSPPGMICQNSKNKMTARLLNHGIVDKLLQTQKNNKFEERLNFWTEFFMNTPYHPDPLGEGTGPDSDPAWNPCAMDCETYVETVMALSLSKNHTQVIKWMDLMRYYEGKRNYDMRFFTMNLSWIPMNLKLGYMKNINSRISTKLGKIGQIVVPEANWKPEWKDRLKRMGKYAPRGLSMVKYVTIDELFDVYKKIPVPAVAFLVGSQQNDNPFLITHMGFILKNKNGKIIWRHASGTHGRLRVEERDFLEYIKMLRRYFGRKNRRYILGMDIYLLSDPTAG